MATTAVSTQSTVQSGVVARWAPSLVIGFMMFGTGAAGLVYEYIIATVIIYLEGNALKQMGYVTGILLIMMGVGGALQVLIKKALVEVFIFGEIILIVFGAFSPFLLQWAFSEFPNDFAAIKFVFLCWMGMLIGFEIPLMARINEQFTSSLKKNIGLITAADYSGAALGLVIYLTVLKHHIPMTHASFYVSGFNLLVAVIALAYFWKKGMLTWKFSGIIASAAIVIVTCATVLGYQKTDVWSRMISQSLYENPIVHEERTAYQDITITKTSDLDAPNGENIELFLNGNKQFASKDERIYHESLVHPAMNLAARHERVLILGGGDGMALREVLKYPEVREVNLVDLDPGMIDLAKNDSRLVSLNEDAFGDARVHTSISEGVNNTGEQRDVMMQTSQIDRAACEQYGMEPAECDTYELQKVGSVDVFTVDADKFMSEQTGPWDVVIIDLPDPNAVELAKLYSYEFYSKVKNSLAEDGMVVVQATSPYHAKETYLCILRTMEAAGLNVVPYHANVPSFGDWGWVLGAPNMSGDQLKQRAETLPVFPVETEEITNEVFHSSLVFNASALESQHDDVSTVMNPVVSQFYTYEGWRTN